MAHECGCDHGAPTAHDHCCGAQLTLREAAASAGVPLEALLVALNEATTTAA
jgi:iron-sulfur cluster repair protein YtfE (RIC family)